MVTDAWARLGIAPTDDARAVKSAYAAALKALDVDRDPGGFIALREARDIALQWGAKLPEWEQPDYDPEQDWADEDWDEAMDGEGAGDGHPAGLRFHLDLDRFESPYGYYGGAGGGRPSAPTSESRRLQDAVAGLDALLFAEALPAPAAIEAATAELLSACAEAPVDEAAGIEQWLLSALARSIPRSDPVFAAAERHFGWGDAVRSRGFGFNHDLHDLIERRTARALLDDILTVRDPDRYYAVAELMQAGRTRLSLFEPGLVRDVQRFLTQTLPAHPMLEHDLDPDTLAWWRAYFDGWHLPQAFWLTLVSYPAVFAMIAGWTGIIRQNFESYATAYGGFFVVLGGGMLAYSWLRVRSARREREHGWYNYRLGPATAAVGLLMLLPALASMLTGGFWIAAGWGLAAALVAACGMLVTPLPIGQDPNGQQMLPSGTPAAGIAACGAVEFSLSLGAADHVAVPFLMLCYLVYRAHRLFADRLPSLPRKRVRLALAGAGLFLVAMLVVLFAFTPRLPPAFLLALLPAAVMAQHLVTAGVMLHITLIEWVARAGAVVFHIAVGQRIFADWGTSALAAILLYLLIYSLIRIAFSWPQVGYRETEPASF